MDEDYIIRCHHCKKKCDVRKCIFDGMGHWFCSDRCMARGSKKLTDF
jgi:hypothetical protein